MQIKRSELLSVLEAVKGAVAAKPFEPILTHCLFDETAVLGWNGEVGVRVKLPSKLEGRFNVHHGTLYSLVRALDAEDVELTVEGKRVILKCGRHKSSLMQMEQEFPKPAVTVAKEQWTTVPAGFAEALERARQTVSKDTDAGVGLHFDCVLVTDSYLYSSDRKRCTRVYLDGLTTAPFLLPPLAAAELARMGNPKRLALVGPLACFDFGNTLFIARAREGAESWPIARMDGVLEDRRASEPIPDGFAQSLQRLLIFAGDSGAVRAVCEPLGLVLRAEGGTATAEEMLPPPAVPFEAKMFDASTLKAALMYADAIDWGRGSTEPLYLAGAAGGYEFIQTPMAWAG